MLQQKGLQRLDDKIEIPRMLYCLLSFQAKAHELDFSCDPTSANIMFKLQLYVQLCPTRMTFVIIKAYGFNDDVVMNVIITKSQGIFDDVYIKSTTLFNFR